jgi:hypothetical protein
MIGQRLSNKNESATQKNLQTEESRAAGRSNRPQGRPTCKTPVKVA